MSNPGSYWHPFADMATVAGTELTIARGEGVHVWDTGCAAALASLDLLENEHLITRGHGLETDLRPSPRGDKLEAS